MMLNNKYATKHKTYYNGSIVHECKQGFLAVKKNFSTCILFLPSEVIKGTGKNHSRYEIVVTIHYYYHITPSNTHHPPHMLSHICLVITSSKKRGNNMHLFIHQQHNKGSNLMNHRIKLNIYHIRIT
jgi:hypothetical protein